VAFLFRPFGFIAPKHIYIVWLSNVSILSVPDEGYSRNVPCALNLISTFYFNIYFAQSQNIGNPKSIKVFINKNTKGPTPRKSKSLISEGHLNAHLVSRGEVNIEKAYFN
jgi:hypothetical protein